MPKPMHRSRSFRRLDRISPKHRHLIHYERRPNSMPHCAICSAELNGVSINRFAKGKSLRSNSRKFGGILCASCSSNVIKLASRIENGEMRLNDISTKERNYVLQMIAH